LANSSNPEQHKTLSLVNRNAKRLLNLVNQLVYIAKIETGQITLRPVTTNVILFTEDLVNGFRPLAADQKMEIFFNQNLEDHFTIFDLELNETILSNLLSNAIKYGNFGGKIWVNLSQTVENHLVWEVKDDGPGIPDDELPKVFDRMFRSQHALLKEKEGMGIGLDLVKKMTELQGGKVAVISALGKGTTFTVSIPLVLGQKTDNSDADIEVLPTQVFNIENESETSADLLKILLVEDNPDMRLFLKSILQQEYNIYEANNGKKGLELALELIPDLIITDVMMPEMDGNSLVRAIRDDIRISHIPIITLTAKADFDNKMDGIESGSDVWLSKPFQPMELALRVRKLLEMRQKLHNLGNQNPIKETETIAELPEKENIFLKTMQEIIAQNLLETDLNGDFIGKKMAMSRMNLHRKVKALTGIGISDHIRIARLNKAHILLQSKDYTVSEVAYQTGFSSPSHFSTIFKNHFGFAPSEI
jgi:DNA-binding response OmpR family regulator